MLSNSVKFAFVFVLVDSVLCSFSIKPNLNIANYDIAYVPFEIVPAPIRVISEEEKESRSLKNLISGRSLLEVGEFSCLNLAADYDAYTFCSGVVDYSFYVESGSSVAALDLAARALSASAIPLLSTPCLSDMKKLICAIVYKPCVSNGKFIYLFKNCFD